jgi:tRNA-dihydrouridine synthase B
MAEAARFNVACGPQIIDINMGCPAKKVCRKAAGSALLADEPWLRTSSNAVVGAVDVPVTLKIRTGVDPEHRNGVPASRASPKTPASPCSPCTAARAPAPSGRGRTRHHGRDRRSRGSRCWPTATSLAGDAQRVLAHTGAAGVMIGRAAQGAPWLPGQIAAASPDASGDRRTSPRSTRDARAPADLHAFYGDPCRAAHRAQAHRLVPRRLPALARGKRAFNRLEAAGEQLAFLDDLFNQLDRQDLAA